MHLDGGASNSSDQPWYVVRVKANAEWKVAESLAGRGMEVFLPLQKRLSRGRRSRSVQTPLFPGYVFVRFDRRMVLPVLMCPGVVHILCRGTAPEAVDPVEMHALMSVTKLAHSLEALPTFAIGQTLRISSGPLTDVHAIVVRDDGGPRLVVSVSLLMRSVVAHVEREWLEEVCADETPKSFYQTGT